MKSTLYITTAIPYVNAKPHIGNALDYLYADIWVRYHKRANPSIKFSVGTDEHGNKIARKAAELGMTPQEFVDQNYGNFQILMDKVGAGYTNFVRTTDGHHVGAVQYIWTRLKKYLYKANYNGWYCTGCERFFTDAEASDNEGICPDHQRPLEHLEEENYYFKASEFSERIRQAVESGEMKIVPEMRKNEFLNLIKDGLSDVSVSRPSKNLAWGIPVPNDPDQVMYVWLDALSNYITGVGYPDQLGWDEIWPADVQVIGKDILRFHAGLWPAMLLALDLPLPKILLAHGHIHVSGVKMSKSLNNVIDPIEVIDNYGRDAFRYYFSRHIPTQDDGDFTWEKFETAYNSELGNDLGNLVQRVAKMIEKYQAGVVADVTETSYDENSYIEAMRNLRFDQAIDEAWSFVHSLNKYIDSVKPWEIAKRIDQDIEAKHHLEEVLRHLANGLVQMARLLEPFMPDTADKIKQIFADGVISQDDQALLPLFPKIYIHTKDPRANSASAPTPPVADSLPQENQPSASN